MKKTKFRRLTALVLAISMVTSMIGTIPAFAGTTSSEDQIATHDKAYAYYEVDENTEPIVDGNTAVEATKTMYQNPTSASGASVEISKTIAPKEKDNFEITLNVVTTSKLDELKVSPDAAVVLVVDSSNSMNGKDLGGTQNRLVHAQDAAKAFIDSFAKEANGAQRLVSVVDFGPYAGVNAYTTDPAKQTTVEKGKGNKKQTIPVNNDIMETVAEAANADNVWFNVADSTGYDQATTVVNNLSLRNVDSETNIEQGLTLTNDLINAEQSGDLQGIETVYVVLLTDGSPTCYGIPYVKENRLKVSETQEAANEIKAGGNVDLMYTVALALSGTDKTVTMTDGTKKSVINWLREDLSSGAAYSFVANDGKELTASFEAISQQINNLAQAYFLTDPMGDYITLGDVELQGEAVAPDDAITVGTDGFTWDLKKVTTPSKSEDTDNDGTNDKFTYTLTYGITLDTDDEDFVEDTYYLTNGATTLTYCFETNGEIGDLNTAYFNVPAVKGEYPDYNYNVKHWQQVTGADIPTEDQLKTGEYVKKGDNYYKLVTEDSMLDQSAKKKAEISADAKNYKNFELQEEMGYPSDAVGYPTAGHHVELLTKGQDLNFYYNRIETAAQVNHHYYTITVAKDGTVGMTSSTTSDSPSETVYVGDSFTPARDAAGKSITKAPVLKGDGTYDYTLIATPTNTTIDPLTAKAEDGTHTNIVDYYYVSYTDNTERHEITVNHVYTTWYWDVVDGDYQLVEGKPDETSFAGVPFKQVFGSTYTADLATKPYNDEDVYTFLPDQTTVSGDFDKGSLGITSLTQNSVITLHYEFKPVEPVENRVPVVVNHVYKTETTVTDGVTGEESVITVTDNATDPVKDTYGAYYVDETFTLTSAREKTDYNGETYNDSITYSKDSIKVAGIAAEDQVTITYVRKVEATTADVTVYHHYAYFEEEIELDETNPDYGTATWVEKYNSGEILDPTQGTGTYYQGDNFPAGLVTGHTGYAGVTGYDFEKATVNGTGTTDQADLTFELQAGANEVHIYYVQKGTPLDDAGITVEYQYITNYYTWENDVQTKYDSKTENPALTETDSGDYGEIYTLVEKSDFVSAHTDYTSEISGWTRTDAYGTTEPMHNQTVTLVYQRNVLVEEETAVVVNYIFTTYTDKVVDGVVTDDVPATEIIHGTWKTGLTTGKVFDVVEDAAILAAHSQFNAKDTNPEHITLGQVDVTSLTPEAMEGTNVINLYYNWYNQDLTPVTVQVIHRYTTYTTELAGDVPVRDDGKTVSVPENVVTGYYLKQYYKEAKANKTPEGSTTKFTLVTPEKEYNNVYLDKTTNIIYIDYVYEDDRTDEATLNVTHTYTTYDLRDGVDPVVEGPFADPSGTIESWATVQHSFNTDAKVDADGNPLFNITNIKNTNGTMDKANKTIVLGKGSNLVEITYDRTIDTRDIAKVIVNHYYGVEDSREATGVRVERSDEDNVFNVAYNYGDDFTAELKELEVTSPFGATYDYDYLKGNPSITLVEGTDTYVIDLYYVREVKVVPTTSYYSLTVRWVDEDGNELVESEVTSRIRLGSAYTTEQKSIEGYTFLKMDESSDPATGTIRSNKEVIYVYNPVEVEIPEEEIPQTEIPETPDDPKDPETPVTPETPDEPDVPAIVIPDEDVPLTDIPEVEIPLTEIPETDVPKGDIPDTGDSRNVAPLAMISLLSAAGLVWLLKQELDEKRKAKASK